MNKQIFDVSDMALLNLYAWVYKEISCVPRLTLIKGYKEKISQNKWIKEDLSHKETSS